MTYDSVQDLTNAITHRRVQSELTKQEILQFVSSPDCKLFTEEGVKSQINSSILELAFPAGVMPSYPSVLEVLRAMQSTGKTCGSLFDFVVLLRSGMDQALAVLELMKQIVIVHIHGHHPYLFLFRRQALPRCSVDQLFRGGSTDSKDHTKGLDPRMIFPAIIGFFRSAYTFENIGKFTDAAQLAENEAEATKRLVTHILQQAECTLLSDNNAINSEHFAELLVKETSAGLLLPAYLWKIDHERRRMRQKASSEFSFSQLVGNVRYLHSTLFWILC